MYNQDLHCNTGNMVDPFQSFIFIKENAEHGHSWSDSKEN